MLHKGFGDSISSSSPHLTLGNPGKALRYYNQHRAALGRGVEGQHFQHSWLISRIVGKRPYYCKENQKFQVLNWRKKTLKRFRNAPQI